MTAGGMDWVTLKGPFPAKPVWDSLISWGREKPGRVCIATVTAKPVTLEPHHSVVGTGSWTRDGIWGRPSPHFSDLEGENSYLLIKERAGAYGLSCQLAYCYSCWLMRFWRPGQKAGFQIRVWLKGS